MCQRQLGDRYRLEVRQTHFMMIRPVSRASHAKASLDMLLCLLVEVCECAHKNACFVTPHPMLFT